MRFSVIAVLLLGACSSGSDVDVRGLWSTQIGPSTICRVFCDDGLTLETLGNDPTCSEWQRFDGLLTCFPYEVDGDHLRIGDSGADRVELGANGEELRWDKIDETLVYTRLDDSHAVCDQPCYRAGNADEPLR